MSDDDRADIEATLDPEDWGEFRAAAHALVDDLITYLETLSTRPVWQAVPSGVRQRLEEPAPEEGMSTAEVLDLVRTLVLPYATGNGHARFFGWVHGSGTPDGMLAEWVAAAMNSNVGGRDHGAIYVERQVLRWFQDVFGYPASAGGLLVSGTSIANLMGLAVARDAGSNSGPAAPSPTLVAYTSERAHVSVDKAAGLLGLGREALRHVPVDGGDRMRVDALAAAIREDRAGGLRPFCVIASAGTVDIGAIDPLDAIADVCREQGLWLHVDGAFGALVALSDSLRDSVAGIERSDSIGFDFHKWLHVPFDAGCILVRDRERLRRTFAAEEAYLERQGRGLGGGDFWPCDYGPELSRGFRALKVWVTVQRHGLAGLALMIEKNCAQAQVLAGLIEAHPRLEMAAPAPLNIVCFRYLPGDEFDHQWLDELQREIVTRVQEGGEAVLSTTRRGGRLAMRAAITNQRTRREDVDRLVHAVARAAEEILAADRRPYSAAADRPSADRSTAGSADSASEE